MTTPESIDLAILKNEHQPMIAAIRNLPDIAILLWTDKQVFWLEEKKKLWQWIGLRIDWFQLVEFGLVAVDPLENTSLHPVHREYLDVLSRYKFAIFRLLVEGFKQIKTTAIKDGRDFPFNNPRELFAQICREVANSEVEEEIASRDINIGTTLTDLRDSLTELNAFCRGNLRGTAKEQAAQEKSILSALRNNQGWVCYWMSVIWEEKNKPESTKELCHRWEIYLKELKNLIKFIKKRQPSRIDGSSLSPLRWNAGHPVHPKSGIPFA